MTDGTKKTTFKTVLMWGGIAVATAIALVPVAFVMRAVSKFDEPSKGPALLAQGKAELARVEALDRTRSQKLEAARTMSLSDEPCLGAPPIAEPPMTLGDDLGGQLWRTYMRDLTSSDSPFELRGSTSMVGVTTEPGGPRFRNLRGTVSMIEGFLRQGSVGVELPPLPSAKKWQRDVTLVIEQFQDPYLPPNKREFEAGHASGTAFLFDYERGDVACVGHFEATNSDALMAGFRQEMGMEFTSDLFRDLQARVIVEGIRSLRAIAPR